MASFSAGNSSEWHIRDKQNILTYQTLQTEIFGRSTKILQDMIEWTNAVCFLRQNLVSLMKSHWINAAKTSTVICDHLIPSVIEFEIEVLHTNLFLQYLNAPSSSSAWSWSKWVRWITPLMSSTIGRTAGRRRGKFIPLSIPLHHLWTWTSHLISRVWLAQP